MSDLTKALEILDSVREASGNGTLIADRSASKHDAVANTFTHVREALELHIFTERSETRALELVKPGWGTAPEPITPMKVVDLRPDVYVANRDGDRLMKWEGEVPPIGQAIQVNADQEDWRVKDVSRRDYGRLILIVVEEPASVYYAGFPTAYNRSQARKQKRALKKKKKQS